MWYFGLKRSKILIFKRDMINFSETHLNYYEYLCSHGDRNLVDYDDQVSDDTACLLPASRSNSLPDLPDGDGDM